MRCSCVSFFRCCYCLSIQGSESDDEDGDPEDTRSKKVGGASCALQTPAFESQPVMRCVVISKSACVLVQLRHLKLPGREGLAAATGVVVGSHPPHADRSAKASPAEGVKGCHDGRILFVFMA